MARFDTTATVSADAYVDGNNPDTARGTNSSFILGVGGASTSQSALISFRIPDQPLGADTLNQIQFVATYRNSYPPNNTTQSFGTRAKKLADQAWTESFVSWDSMATQVRWPNSTVSGSSSIFLSSKALTTGTISSFAWDVTALGLTWGQNGSVFITAGTYTLLMKRIFYSIQYATSTTAFLPHIVVTFTDNPPAAITDLSLTPDISLSEASYTYRQRALLKWTTTSATDFSRYRIRKGINRSQASDHTHLTFVNSRGTTSYLDATLYTDGSTIYYSLYPEDTRNKSASTNANVSNIVSWTKPDATMGGLNFGSSASTLDQVEARVRTTTMANAKKLKLVWGDGSIAYSQNLTSAGGYLYARHRYTKATSGYTIRSIIEDIYGFRSAPKSYSTSITISNLGPIAKIVASPSRQRTGATFSFGTGPISSSEQYGAIMFQPGSACPADGIATRVSTKTSSIGGVFVVALLRDEGQIYRVVYSDRFTTATANGFVKRNVSWYVRRGDFITIQSVSGDARFNQGATSQRRYALLSTYVISGVGISKWRFITDGIGIGISAQQAYTNPVYLSSKDSFARGSNKTINRFRWAPNYAGDFGAAYASGGSYTTGATSSFYWAWTTATTQFVAVRAVDDTNASSIDVAGVVIETESTFRIPDQLTNGVAVHLSEKRPRAYTHSPALSRDYGNIDLGALEPWTINVKGRSFMSTATNNFYTDISNLQAAFQQRWRIYVRAPATTSSYVQGYLVDVPFVQDTNEPTVKVWDATIVVAT